MTDQTVAARWNEIALEAVRLGDAKPTEITRALHIAHSAMYDAWAAYDDDAAGAYSNLTASGPGGHFAQATAVSYAAHSALRAVFPDHKFLFDTLLSTLLSEADDAGRSPAAEAVELGQKAAEAVLQIRSQDGSNVDYDFRDTSDYEPVNEDSGEAVVDPNHWTPLRVPNGTVRDENGTPIATDNPATYDLQKPLTPHWGDVTPFAIDSGDAYRPDAPPQLGDFGEYVDQNGQVTTGDAAYREQFGAVLNISANLTDAQKATAEYWADGPQSSSPPGHWNEIAQDVSLREGHDLASDVKFFFALNNALFDAGVAVWDAKYEYDFVRPQSAIRYLYDGEQVFAWMGPDQGAGLIDGADWVPYQDVTFVTPPFPEFVSGHSGFSYAAATIIDAFTGSDVLFDGVSRGLKDLDGDGVNDLIGSYSTDDLAFESYSGPAIQLSWDTVWDAAADAGLSRLYGGIHIQDGDLAARKIGAEVGQDVWAETSRLFTQDAAEEIRPADDVNLLDLGTGDDVLIGDLGSLDGLRVLRFTQGDSIRIEGLDLGDDGLAVKRGSAILEIDTDGDGLVDGTITLEGDFDDLGFRALTQNGETFLTLADGADIALGDADEQFYTQDTAANVIAAGAGDDDIRAGGGDDIVDGDAGDDVLRGEDGDDVLIGGLGNDTLSGGAGRDVFAITATQGTERDVISDYTRGEDRIELAGFGRLGPQDVQLGREDGDLVVTFNTGQSLRLEGITSLADISLADVDTPTGGRNVDFSELPQQVLSTSDDVFVSTDAVDDTIDGRDGDDWIRGGAGDDVITGGRGSDTLEGGSGADLFRITGEDLASGTVDVIRGFTSKQDKIQFIGIPGVASLGDLKLTRVDGDLAVNLGNDNLIKLEGITSLSQLSFSDAIIGGNAPTLNVGLTSDTGSSGSDGVTRSGGVSGDMFDDVGISTFEVRIGNGRWTDITNFVGDDGSFAIPSKLVANVLGDGVHSVEFRVTDLEGKSTANRLDFTLDRSGPTILGNISDGLSETLDSVTVVLSEQPSDDLDASDFVITDGSGTRIDVTSIDVTNGNQVVLTFESDLPDGTFALSARLEDLAGNTRTINTNFEVEAATRVLAIRPVDGSDRANLDGKITVEFNRPVDAATIDADSVKITALDQTLDGRFQLSSDGTLLTFFPDELLPAATGVRVLVDGDQVRDVNGAAVSTASEGSATFSTASLTRIENTNVEGFIFDANYRDEDDLDIPLEGVVVSVIGLPGVTAVTDANGRFYLEDLPIPQAYLDFDASGVSNRPNLDYGTITKPIDTIAGQTVGLTSGDKAFNIYFAALAEADVTTLKPGEQTEAGIGENGLENLAEIFPGIDPELWTQLKVKIPADSLTRDDGTPVEEVQVMAFEPDRIPAPLPQGFDPTVVFTVKAGDATNVDGKAQIEFPNIDELALGEQRPILSFDHDAGVWIQTGTAIVVDDGNGGTILQSEGDSGVNTLGWKAVGSDPTVSVNEDPKSHEDLGIGDAAFNTVRDGVGTALGLGSAYVGAVDTVLNVVNVIEPFPGPVDLISLGLTGLSGTLSIAGDLASSSGQVSGTTYASIGLGLGGDASGTIPVPALNAVGAVGLTAAATGVGLYGTYQTLESFLDNAGDFGAGVLEWADMVGNDIEEAVGEIGDNINERIQAVEDYADRKIQQIGDAVEAGADILEKVGQVLDTARQVGRFVDNLVNPLPQLRQPVQSSASGPAALNQVPIMTGDQLAEMIEIAQENISQILMAYPGSSIKSALLQSVDSVQTSVGEFEEFASIALEDSVGQVFFAYTLESGLVVRSVSDASGEINMVLPPDQLVEVSYFDPDTGFVRTRSIDTSSDHNHTNSEVVIFDRDLVDTDGDGLGEVAEFVLGTDPDSNDSDGDGITDGAEVEQGLNPLDGIAFPTGTIASLGLKGESLDVTLTGGVGGAEGQTAYLATGTHGLAIVDASQFQNPILQAELDLEGTAKQVAADANLDLAFIAAGDGGLHIVDVSDSLAPERVATTIVQGGAHSVVNLGGTLLVGGGSQLVLLNAATGTRITDIDSGGFVNDLAVDGDIAYAIVDNTELVTFQISGSAVVELDREAFPQSTIRTIPKDKTIFVNEGVAYVSNALEVSNVPLFRLEERGGYLTYDVADPTSVSLISNIDTPRVQAGNLETIVNGSGLALVAAGFRGLQVHDASDPDVTYDLLGEFETPGEARGVALASGIVYVADGTGGLQVINVLPFDSQGQAPEITLDAQASDADAQADGIQIEEGARISLALDISDDVQVRNVELLLNGEVVLNDVSAPFELGFNTPTLASLDGDQLSIQVRATDTGGNSTLTDAVTVQVIEDITPPEVLSVQPTSGRLLLQGREQFTVSFSERIDPDTVTLDDIVLTRTADGVEISPVGLVFLTGGQVAQITFDPLDLGAHEISIDLSDVQDFAGNAVGGAPITQSFEIVDASSIWINPTGGEWTTATNWQGELLPGSDDGVAIVLDQGATVTINNYAAGIDVEKIRLDGTLQLDSGTLDAGLIEGTNGVFSQTGGTLLNTTITGEPEFEVRAAGTATQYGYGAWDGVRLETAASVQYGSLRLKTDLTLDGGNLTVDGNDTGTSGYRSSTLYVSNGTDVSGTGSIRLEGRGANLQTFGNYTSTTATPAVVIGAGVDVVGNGSIEGSIRSGGIQLLGTLRADGGTLNVSGIGQAGGQLNLDTIDDAIVSLDNDIENARLAISTGANVHLSNGSDIAVDGPGALRLVGGTIEDLDVAITGTAIVEDVANFNANVTIRDGLNIDGLLTVDGVTGSGSSLTLRDMIGVSGTGTLSLVSEGNSSDAELVFAGPSYSARGTDQALLSFGQGLTLTGAGTVRTAYSGDSIQILGDVEGQSSQADTALNLYKIDQDGADLNVDTTQGAVRLVDRFDNATLTGTGFVDFASGLDLRNVTIASSARVSGQYGDTATVHGGLNVDGLLEVYSRTTASAELDLSGTQTVGGSGRIVLSGPNGSSDLEMSSTSSMRESVTFGSDLTLSGNGSISAANREDTIRILGEVEGVAGGTLKLNDIDNLGATLAVDATQGTVAVRGSVQNTTFVEADGASGELTLQNGAILENVEFDMDVVLAGSTSSPSVKVLGDLFVNETLVLVAGASRTPELEVRGNHTLDGSGTIRLTNAPAPAGAFQESRIEFASLRSSREVMTIGSDLTIEGTGSVKANSTMDRISVEGTLRADNGRLDVQYLDAVEGELAATDDGVMAIRGDLELSERATATFGLADAGQGQMTVSEGAVLGGTLNLEVGSDFTATLGDQYTLLTATDGTTGTFDAFTGFDLAGNLAFEVVSNGGSSLQVRVTNDATARAAGFIDAGPYNPSPREDDARDAVFADLLSGTVLSTRLVGSETVGVTPELANNTQLVDAILETDVSGRDAFGSHVVTVSGGLGLSNGATLSFRALDTGTTRLQFFDSSALTGTGTLDFMLSPVGNGQADMTFSGLGTLPETFQIGEDITITGSVDVTTSGSEDRIRILGDIVGRDGETTTLRRIDNQGDVLNVDATHGVVEIDTVAENTQFAGQGSLLFGSSLNLANVTLGMDARVIGEGGSGSVSISDGFAMDDATLSVESKVRSATVSFVDEQTVGGSGTIELSSSGTLTSNLRFTGDASFAETLTFGEDIDIVGAGIVSASQSNDKISILGGVAAMNGNLVLRDIDNDGADLTVMTSTGGVWFGDTIQDVRITGGEQADVFFANGLKLQDVTLATDILIGNETGGSASVTVGDGLIFDDGTLTVSNSVNRNGTLTFNGSQEVLGTGAVYLQDLVPLLGNTQAQLTFTGAGNGDDVVVIGEDIDLIGAGTVQVFSGVEVEMRGDVIVDDGIMNVRGDVVMTGDLRIETDGHLSRAADLQLDSQSTLTMAVAGAGIAAHSGAVTISGSLELAGSFAFDVAADFDAEVGTEFTLMYASSALGGGFDDIADFTFGDGSKGLSLVVRENSVNAVVVDASQAGQQFTASTVPNGTLPVLDRTITSAVIDQAFAGGDVAIAPSSSIWQGVTLESDVVVQSTTQGRYSRLSVEDGLTLNGRLTIDGWNGGTGGYSAMRVDGGTTIGGTGEIRLGASGPSGPNASFYAVESQLTLTSTSSSAETTTIGEDITVFGAGTIAAYGADRWQILGDVVATSGQLEMSGINQGGETLSLSSTQGGRVVLSGNIENGTIALAQGSRALLNSATLTDVTLAGDETFEVSGGRASNVVIDGSVQQIGNRTLTVEDDLEVNGVLSLESTNTTAYTEFSGSQMVGGTGEIRLIQNDVNNSETQIYLQNRTSTGSESLTFGEDLTLSGVGYVRAQGASDYIRILGTVEGNQSYGIPTDTLGLRLANVDQDDGTITLDAREGAITFEDKLENAQLVGQGTVQYKSGVAVRSVTQDIDVNIIAGVTYFDGDMTINGDLALEQFENASSNLYLRGTQTVTGTGTIDLSGGPVGASDWQANPNKDDPSSSILPENRLYGQSQISEAEVFVLDEGITVTGGGYIYTSSNTDSMRILGTLLGSEGDVLRVDDLDNNGASLAIDVSVGEVRLGTVENTVLDEVAGQTGELTFFSGARLTDVTVNIDARLGVGTVSNSISSYGDLTLNADLTLGSSSGGESYLYVREGGSLLGTGRVVMLDDEDQGVGSRLFFYGADSTSETMAIGDGIDVIGKGALDTSSASDSIAIQGRVIADDGELNLARLADLDGTIGASATGILDVNDELVFNDTARLEIGLNSDGVGLVDVRDGASLDGTLALDVSDDFTAQLGDTFVIMASTNALTGSFDAYEGFDLDGGLAFKLNTDGTTLNLQVTTDADALEFI